MGKSFEKQIKTIEDQGEKLIKAIIDNKKQLSITNADYYENRSLNSKQRKIFMDIYNRGHDKLEELNKQINYDDLNYIVKSTNEETDFTIVENPVVFLESIKIAIEEAKLEQEELNEYLKEIRKKIKIKNKRKR